MTTNRLTSVTDGSTNASVAYDGAGNFVSYNGATYEYDPLQMMKKSVVGGVVRSYVYNASNERIATIEQTPSGNRSEWTIRNQAGQVLRRYSKETSGEWKWQEDYIYRGSHMLAAEVPDSAKVRHFHLDHLGTPRLITGYGGAEISRHNYHPFGEEINPRAAPREQKQFTGHERDAESLDYMHARFYAPYMGRFLSVDPAWESAHLTNPQTWNRYSYVENNPINKVDPDGRNPLGAFIGGAIAVGVESYKQVTSGRAVDNRRLLAALTGGAVAGGTGGLGGATLRGAVRFGALGGVLGAVYGRFLSVDPGAADLRQPQTWNRYTYATNDPIGNNDPDGRLTSPVTYEVGQGRPILHRGGGLGEIRKRCRDVTLPREVSSVQAARDGELTCVSIS